MRDPVTVRETGDTELDSTKIVSPTADGGAKQNNNGPHDFGPHDHSPHDEALVREVVIDPKGQEVLFGAVDIRAEHADQSPNQALMRQRAYRQRQTPSDDSKPSDNDPHADIEA